MKKRTYKDLLICIAGALGAFLFFFFPAPCLKSSQAGPISIDLHPYGFPAELPIDEKIGVFYLSADRLAVFFNNKQPLSGPGSEAFQLIVLDISGHGLAQRNVLAAPKAMDLTPGPNGRILFGRSGQLDFFDSGLHLLKTVPLGDSVTGISFNRRLNQLVEMTIDDVSQTRTAHFLDGDSLEENLSLTYPLESAPHFGDKQLAYTRGGNCFGSARIVSVRKDDWAFLSDLPACDFLTFIGNDEIAYAFDQRLYVVDRSGKQIMKARIPVLGSFSEPGFVGISDNYQRLAIAALTKNIFFPAWAWPNEIFVYDLKTKRRIFNHTLPINSWASALSPEGHQLAAIENGILKLIPIP
ncbi:MAG: hypothetical protein WCD49_18235 [Candidatus Acidiferrales bacterium]